MQSQLIEGEARRTANPSHETCNQHPEPNAHAPKSQARHDRFAYRPKPQERQEVTEFCEDRERFTATVQQVARRHRISERDAKRLALHASVVGSGRIGIADPWAVVRVDPVCFALAMEGEGRVQEKAQRSPYVVRAEAERQRLIVKLAQQKARAR